MTLVFELDAATLTEIVGDVFAGLFGDRYERPWELPTNAGLPVAGQVAVRGGWDGEVVVSCSPELARRAAAELFDIAADGVTDDDLRDVVGEFANVIGGNVKSVMPGPSSLSLPVAALVGGIALPGRVEALRLDLTWRGEPLRIGIWKVPA